VFNGDAFNERLFDKEFELRREFSPVPRDLLAEEYGGELADIGSFGGAKVLSKGWDHLRIFG
jgi:hypothetical protein